MSASPAAKSGVRHALPLHAKSSIVVKVANQQRRATVSDKRLRSAIHAVLAGEGYDRADISLAVVNDATIHDINRRYLNHDEPTDVISFLLDQADGFIDGEIVISADTAAASAMQFGWDAADELLLYVIHGALHLAGYDDLAAGARRKMRERERFYLAELGIAAPKPIALKRPQSLGSGSTSQPRRPTARKSRNGASRS